jgi:hypothetical protein
MIIVHVMTYASIWEVNEKKNHEEEDKKKKIPWRCECGFRNLPCQAHHHVCSKSPFFCNRAATGGKIEKAWASSRHRRDSPLGNILWTPEAAVDRSSCISSPFSSLPRHRFRSGSTEKKSQNNECELLLSVSAHLIQLSLFSLLCRIHHNI